MPSIRLMCLSISIQTTQTTIMPNDNAWIYQGEQQQKESTIAAAIDYHRLETFPFIYIYFECRLFNAIELCFSALQSGNTVIKMHLLPVFVYCAVCCAVIFHSKPFFSAFVFFFFIAWVSHIGGLKYSLGYFDSQSNEIHLIWWGKCRRNCAQ